MLPTEVRITDEDIRYAEIILFDGKFIFTIAPDDDEEIQLQKQERINFIKNLETLDVQAVPGSGKTTALLAKLLILEKYLPFDDGSGILVLSHTNNAVDEIKKKIAVHCPRLFNYPNFVGTIQSFVNKFLATPCYKLLYKQNLENINTNLFLKRSSEYDSINYLTGSSQDTRRKTMYFLNSNNKFLSFKYDHNTGSVYIYDYSTSKKLNIKKPRSTTPASDWSSSEKTDIEKCIKAFIVKCHRYSVISFEDAYFLADYYIHKQENILEIIKQRFQCIFVDEMQDMEKHQHDLLEKLFFTANRAPIVYQRIGDANQAIYSSTYSSDHKIEIRNELNLQCSHRLSPAIAHLASKFSIYSSIPINGKNGSGLKPHLIVFSDTTLSSVVQKYKELIVQYIASGKITNHHSLPLKVVSWVTEKTDSDNLDLSKLCLTHFHRSFKKKNNNEQIEHKVLIDYFVFYKKHDNIFSAIRSNIINALLKILQLEKHQVTILIGNKNSNRYLNKTTLFNELKNDEVAYELFKATIFQCCILTIKQNIEHALKGLRDYIQNSFLPYFDKEIKHSSTFISSDTTSIHPHTIADTSLSNVLIDGDLAIHFESVHASKGQTHCATLYIESFYNGKYEINHVKDLFQSYKSAAELIHSKNEQINDINQVLEQLDGGRGTLTREDDKKKIISEINKIQTCSKMMYVGLSRATDFLALAIHQSRYDEHLLDHLDAQEWEIIHL